MNDENITNNSEEELSDNIITLTDEEGKESNFELLDLVELDNEEYVVLLPVDDEESEEPGEVVILKVEDSDDDSDEETESYVSVEDEETLTKLLYESTSLETGTAPIWSLIPASVALKSLTSLAKTTFALKKTAQTTNNAKNLLKFKKKIKPPIYSNIIYYNVYLLKYIKFTYA